MTKNMAETYQSILARLSNIPVSYLQQVDEYLQRFSKEINQREQNREQILALAGSWDDWTEEDFTEYLQETKKVGGELFLEDYLSTLPRTTPR